MELTLWSFFGHASFALTAVSFYVKDMLVLRSLSICAGVVGLLYNYNLESGPLWLVIFWLCVFMSINALRIAHLVYETRQVKFSDEERELFERLGEIQQARAEKEGKGFLDRMLEAFG